MKETVTAERVICDHCDADVVVQRGEPLPKGWVVFDLGGGWYRHFCGRACALDWLDDLPVREFNSVGMGIEARLVAGFAP